MTTCYASRKPRFAEDIYLKKKPSAGAHFYLNQMNFDWRVPTQNFDHIIIRKPLPFPADSVLGSDDEDEDDDDSGAPKGPGAGHSPGALPHHPADLSLNSDSKTGQDDSEDQVWVHLSNNHSQLIQVGTYWSTHFHCKDKSRTDLDNSYLQCSSPKHSTLETKLLKNSARYINYVSNMRVHQEMFDHTP